MSNVVCLEEARAARMRPLRLILLDTDNGRISITVTHDSGATHTVWMSPAKAECMSAALLALAATARAEGTDGR